MGVIEEGVAGHFSKAYKRERGVYPELMMMSGWVSEARAGLEWWGQMARSFSFEFPARHDLLDGCLLRMPSILSGTPASARAHNVCTSTSNSSHSCCRPNSARMTAARHTERGPRPSLNPCSQNRDPFSSSHITNGGLTICFACLLPSFLCFVLPRIHDSPGCG